MEVEDSAALGIAVDVPKHALDLLTFRSSKRAQDLFISEYNKPLVEYSEGRIC